MLVWLISCKYGYIQNYPGMNSHCPLSTDFTPSLWNKGNGTKIGFDEILMSVARVTELSTDNFRVF